MIPRTRLDNGRGMSVDVIALGAAITALRVPDRHGAVSDVVLGYDQPDQYKANPFYFGVVVGRCANRIARGKFALDDINYQLARNLGEHHLHGGAEGFHQRLWSLEQTSTGERVTLNYHSDNGEENYPGQLDLTVSYALTEHNALVIEYGASCDQRTIINPTQHSYFNLGGHQQGNILDHMIRINADKYTPTGPDQIPTGELAQVDKTALDLREFTRIGDALRADHPQLQTAGGFDHNYVLPGAADGKLVLAAELRDPGSGRTLKVLTDQPGLQFYSGNFIGSGSPGKSGAIYQRHAGLCLETQHFPDSPNNPLFPSVELLPGERFNSKTVYQFGIF